MQNQCNLNVRSKCILNALRIRKGRATIYEFYDQKFYPTLDMLFEKIQEMPQRVKITNSLTAEHGYRNW